ncbi:DNA primase [Geodia barretti]|uniref:DNA primase n=1 Tax=Geodia barretti TaxID=519541 RepID=A0AA35T9S4_GEOBA|nr:DNA primase [Geodia barretti]
MKAENLEFGEAIRQLARQVGVQLSDGRNSRSDHPAFRINEAACAFFQRTLASTQGADARSYMERRGLDRAASEAFQLGLAPEDGESLRTHLLREGFDAAQLVAAGIVREGDDGQQRDLFRGRLIIPIREAEGRLAGFGGRALDDSQPKYLNSPQSEVFDKSRILYALDRARDSIRRDGAVIVEGYMDAIAAHQAGFQNVVASMGTALTEPQVNTIRRLTDRVTMALDQDAAGQQATLRSLESSWRIYHSRVAGRSGDTTVLQRQENPEIRIATLPPGQDPDEVIRRSPSEWKELVENARPLLEFVISTMSASVDTSLARGKAAIANQVSRLIFTVQDGPQQDQYFRMLAEKLEVPLDTLRASVSRPAQERRPRSSSAGQAPTESGEAVTASPFARLDHDPLEEYCLSLLLRHPDLGEYAQPLTEDMFLRAENREIFSRLLLDAASLTEQEEIEEIHSRAEEFNDGPLGIREQLESLKARTLPPMDLLKRRRALGDVVARLEERNLRQQKKDEYDRFVDSPEGLNDEDHRTAVALNERLKRNQETRSGLRASH